MAKRRRTTAKPLAQNPTPEKPLQSFVNKHRQEILISLMMVVSCVLIFSQVRRFGFISLDDGSYIYQNPNLMNGLSLPAIGWAFTTFHSTNWHPLTWLSHLVDVQLFGFDSGFHHLTNVFFHALNSICLFLFLDRATRRRWSSAIVAMLFAVHPLHVESVAWVAERKDVLSTLFWILTMWAYAIYVERPSRRKYLWVIVFLGLGLLAKPMLVTLPFALLLLDYWPLNRVSWVRGDGWQSLIERTWPLVREKLPLFLMVGASSVVTFVAQRTGGAVQSFERFPFQLRLTNVFVSYVRYLGKMFWPAGLSVWYPYPEHLPAWHVVLSAILLLGITLFVIWQSDRRRYLFTGWFWFLGTLIPVIGLVQVGSQSIADRYTYVPLIGLFLLVVWIGSEQFQRWKLTALLVGLTVAGILLALGIVSWRQVGFWRNNETIYAHAIAVTNGNWLASHNLCVELVNNGRADEAYSHCADALRFNRNYTLALNSMGIVLMQQEKPAEAEMYFRRYVLADPSQAQIYVNLSMALAAQNRTSEAVDALAKAQTLDPSLATGRGRFIQALCELAEAYGREKKIVEAWNYLNQAENLQPQNIDAHLAKTRLLLDENKAPEALPLIAEAVRQFPNNAKAQNLLGEVLVAEGRTPEAIEHFALAQKLNPNYSAARDNLKETHE